MKRSPATEVFSVPLYIIFGIILLSAAHFVLSSNLSGPVNQLPNALFMVVLVVVPSVLATLPAYGLSVFLRRKGMSFAKAIGLFSLLVLISVGALLNLFGAGDNATTMTLTITMILTALFAGLEIRRPKIEAS